MSKNMLRSIGILLVALGVLIPALTLVLTFMLPETYSASAKLLFPANTTLPLAGIHLRIVSRATLDQVITQLNLRSEWGRKFRRGELTADECAELLRRSIVVKSPRRSQVIEITAFSNNKDEAALIANHLTTICVATMPGASIIQQAQAAARPIRPNKRLNTVVGINLFIVLTVLGIFFLRTASKNRLGNS